MGPSTDWGIVREVWELNRSVLLLVLLSGVFALVYNLLLYNMVTTLSPIYAQFTSIFNRALVMFVAAMLGLEPLPTWPWNCLTLVGIMGTLAAFTMYNIWPHAFSQ